MIVSPSEKKRSKHLVLVPPNKRSMPIHLRYSFGLVAAVAVLLTVIYSTQVAPDDESTSSIRTVVERYADQGRSSYANYAQLMELRLNESLMAMFDDLDKNHDGFIEKSEFRGKTLRVIAAMRSLDMPQFPQLPNLPTVETSVSLARRVVGLQFAFLVFLFIAEHIRIMFIAPFALSTGPINWKANARQADKSRALQYDTPPNKKGLYETLKFLFFLLSGLLLLRIVLTILFFTVAILFVNLSVVGGRTRAGNPTWFSWCSALTKVFGYLALASMGFYCIRVKGHPASRSEAKLLIGNHICMIEVIALYLLADLPSFVSRVENLSIPLFRGIAAASDAVIVDRDAAASRTKTLDAIKRRATDRNATQLLIFPEGTCNNQLSLFQFKKGAFEPGEPVQMVCFKFPYSHFNLAWTGRASGGNDAWDLLLRMWSQFVNRLEVRFLPVYTPTEEERMNPQLYATRCQHIMADVLKCDVSEASYKDYVEAYKRFNKKEIVNSDDSNATTPRGGSPSPQ